MLRSKSSRGEPADDGGDLHEKSAALRQHVEWACRHLLSEQNRDPYTPTYGCFDRRYWGWKLVDYPEATFQRNVYPLAWLIKQIECYPSDSRSHDLTLELLTQAVKAGLGFAVQIQHKNGSFDQAFPYEQSFGATAFLLHPLLQAYQIIEKASPLSLQESVKDCLQRAANFLCQFDEMHGHIANHLAGAALSLLVSAEFFKEPKYAQRATELLERILQHQSSEGWFLEYEGADPGYQTLCLYYLAQIYRIQPETSLKSVLEQAIVFLSWFVHPDGTFGGEYGSRRTSVFYPGGLALLSREFPLADRMTRFMLRAVIEGYTVTLRDIDMGNFAPLLSNYLLVLESDLPDTDQEKLFLPCEQGDVAHDFPQAGLYIRGTERYYAIVGGSNGGVLKVFDRQKHRICWDDGGYVGQMESGDYITTQITDFQRSCHVAPRKIVIETPFYYMLHSTPAPSQFVLLRLLNLTLMRNISWGNRLKKMLVRVLISGKRTVPLTLTRTIAFERDQVHITDVLRSEKGMTLKWLEFGQPFVAIHMASARYFEGSRPGSREKWVRKVDVGKLNALCELHQQVTI